MYVCVCVCASLVSKSKQILFAYVHALAIAWVNVKRGFCGVGSRHLLGFLAETGMFPVRSRGHEWKMSIKTCGANEQRVDVEASGSNRTDSAGSLNHCTVCGSMGLCNDLWHGAAGR